MSRLIRLGIATALLGAVAAPMSAGATGGCFPHFYEQHMDVAGHDVTYYDYQMIC